MTQSKMSYRFVFDDLPPAPLPGGAEEHQSSAAEVQAAREANELVDEWEQLATADPPRAAAEPDVQPSETLFREIVNAEAGAAEEVGAGRKPPPVADLDRVLGALAERLLLLRISQKTLLRDIIKKQAAAADPLRASKKLTALQESSALLADSISSLQQKGASMVFTAKSGDLVRSGDKDWERAKLTANKNYLRKISSLKTRAPPAVDGERLLNALLSDTGALTYEDFEGNRLITAGEYVERKLRYFSQQKELGRTAKQINKDLDAMFGRVLKPNPLLADFPPIGAPLGPAPGRTTYAPNQVDAAISAFISKDFKTNLFCLAYEPETPKLVSKPWPLRTLYRPWAPGDVRGAPRAFMDTYASLTTRFTEKRADSGNVKLETNAPDLSFVHGLTYVARILEKQASEGKFPDEASALVQDIIKSYAGVKNFLETSTLTNDNLPGALHRLRGVLTINQGSSEQTAWSSRGGDNKPTPEMIEKAQVRTTAKIARDYRHFAANQVATVRTVMMEADIADQLFTSRWKPNQIFFNRAMEAVAPFNFVKAWIPVLKTNSYVRAQQVKESRSSWNSRDPPGHPGRDSDPDIAFPMPFDDKANPKGVAGVAFPGFKRGDPGVRGAEIDLGQVYIESVAAGEIPYIGKNAHLFTYVQKQKLEVAAFTETPIHKVGLPSRVEVWPKQRNIYSSGGIFGSIVTMLLRAVLVKGPNMFGHAASSDATGFKPTEIHRLVDIYSWVAEKRPKISARAKAYSDNFNCIHIFWDREASRWDFYFQQLDGTKFEATVTARNLKQLLTRVHDHLEAFDKGRWYNVWKHVLKGAHRYWTKWNCIVGTTQFTFGFNPSGAMFTDKVNQHKMSSALALLVYQSTPGISDHHEAFEAACARLEKEEPGRHSGAIAELRRLVASGAILPEHALDRDLFMIVCARADNLVEDISLRYTERTADVELDYPFFEPHEPKDDLLSSGLRVAMHAEGISIKVERQLGGTVRGRQFGVRSILDTLPNMPIRLDYLGWDLYRYQRFGIDTVLPVLRHKSLLGLLLYHRGDGLASNDATKIWNGLCAHYVAYGLGIWAYPVEAAACFQSIELLRGRLGGSVADDQLIHDRVADILQSFLNNAGKDHGDDEFAATMMKNIVDTITQGAPPTMSQTIRIFGKKEGYDTQVGRMTRKNLAEAFGFRGSREMVTTMTLADNRNCGELCRSLFPKETGGIFEDNLEDAEWEELADLFDVAHDMPPRRSGKRPSDYKVFLDNTRDLTVSQRRSEHLAAEWEYVDQDKRVVKVKEKFEKAPPLEEKEVDLMQAELESYLGPEENVPVPEAPFFSALPATQADIEAKAPESTTQADADVWMPFVEHGLAEMLKEDPLVLQWPRNINPEASFLWYKNQRANIWAKGLRNAAVDMATRRLLTELTNMRKRRPPMSEPHLPLLTKRTLRTALHDRATRLLQDPNYIKNREINFVIQGNILDAMAWDKGLQMPNPRLRQDALDKMEANAELDKPGHIESLLEGLKGKIWFDPVKFKKNGELSAAAKAAGVPEPEKRRGRGREPKFEEPSDDEIDMPTHFRPAARRAERALSEPRVPLNPTEAKLFRREAKSERKERAKSVKARKDAAFEAQAEKVREKAAVKAAFMPAPAAAELVKDGLVKDRLIRELEDPKQKAFETATVVVQDLDSSKRLHVFVPSRGNVAFISPINVIGADLNRTTAGAFSAQPGAKITPQNRSKYHLYLPSGQRVGNSEFAEVPSGSLLFFRSGADRFTQADRGTVERALRFIKPGSAPPAPSAEEDRPPEKLRDEKRKREHKAARSAQKGGRLDL